MLIRLFHWPSGAGGPAENMAADEALLEWVERLEAPVLRLYGWAVPAATFGYFQKYAEVEAMTSLRPLLRRPTGGGLVPHDGDWTYSLAFPPSHPWYALSARQSYQTLHQWVQGALARMGQTANLATQPAKLLPGQCFAGPEEFDVVWAGRKLAGAAQRRNRMGLLIQGSVQPPPDWDRAGWETALLEVARSTWQTECRPWTPPSDFLVRVEELVGMKYSQDAYHRRR